MEETQLLRDPVCRPGEPTSAAPGSPRKVRVLIERAARREPLFHPLDGIKPLASAEPAEVVNRDTVSVIAG